MELYRPNTKNFQKRTFRALKIKNPTLKDFLIFPEMELFCLNLKTCKACKSKISYIFLFTFFVC